MYKDDLEAKSEYEKTQGLFDTSFREKLKNKPIFKIPQIRSKSSKESKHVKDKRDLPNRPQGMPDYIKNGSKPVRKLGGNMKKVDIAEIRKRAERK